MSDDLRSQRADSATTCCGPWSGRARISASICRHATVSEQGQRCESEVKSLRASRAAAPPACSSASLPDLSDASRSPNPASSVATVASAVGSVAACSSCRRASDSWPSMMRAFAPRTCALMFVGSDSSAVWQSASASSARSSISAAAARLIRYVAFVGCSRTAFE